MANIAHKLQFSTTSSQGTASLTGYDTEGVNTNGEISGNITFAANSNNAAVSPFSFNGAKLQDIFMVASQPCTLYTNGSNANSVVFAAGIPFTWGISFPANSNYATNPWAGTNTVNSATLTCNTATSFKYLIGSA